MTVSRRSIRSIAAVSVVILLGACGGGEGDASGMAMLDARAASFQGHWVACWPTSSTTSDKDDVHITSLGDGELNVTRTYTQHFPSLDCSGAPLLLEEEVSELTLTGETVTVSGVTLEKFTRAGTVVEQVPDPADPDSTVPQPRAAAHTAFAGFIAGSSTKMRFGREDTLNAQGHPTALTPLEYHKQP